MDAISTYLASLNISTLSLFALFLLAGSLILGCIGRFVFGKHSTLSLSVSSAIGILFIYALNIVLHSAGAEFSKFIAPLPFVTIVDDTLFFFRFSGAELTVICYELVGLIVLSLLMNLIDQLIPTGKNIFSWVFFRVITLVLAQAGFLLVNWLMTAYLPGDFLIYAPAVVLGVLLLMLLTGALKILLGLFLTTVNPVIAVLYTFFFANMIGKQITKAVFTTAIIALLVFGLEYLGIAAIFIAAEALTVYIPLLVVLLLLWRIIQKHF